MKPATPAATTWAWRALLASAAVGYAVIAAVAVRGLVGGFGTEATGMLVVLAGTMSAMLAILPMAAIIDLPEAIWLHWLPERRWRASRCPNCAHDCRATRCAECGAPFERPPAWAADWSSLRRALWVLVPAGVVGAAVGVAACAADEREFAEEVSAARARDPELVDHARPRRWPASFAELRWNAGRGFTGPPPFESPKIPG